MTQETLQLVEEFYSALADRNLELAVTFLADDVEIRQNAMVPWGGTFHGHSGFRDFVRRLFESIRTEVAMTEYVDSDNKVVAIGTSRGTANASGSSFDIRVVHTWESESGYLSRWEICIEAPAMHEALSGS